MHERTNHPRQARSQLAKSLPIPSTVIGEKAKAQDASSSTLSAAIMSLHLKLAVAQGPTRTAVSHQCFFARLEETTLSHRQLSKPDPVARLMEHLHGPLVVGVRASAKAVCPLGECL